MASNKTILLTFDVEEFDLPLEYGIPIDRELQLRIAHEGLQAVLTVLEKHDIRATFFTTAYFAESYPELIRTISKNHEIASHMYFHSNHRVGDVKYSRDKLTSITSKPILGFRSPRLEVMPSKEIKSAGYQYDASLNPTYLPNRYNNFFKKRTIHFDKEKQMNIVPMSVTPIFRFPLFWLSFKNINYHLYLLFCKWCLRNDGYLHLYFHPWEFSNLDRWDIPKIIKRYSGERLGNRLDRLIGDLKRTSSFETIESYLHKHIL